MANYAQTGPEGQARVAALVNTLDSLGWTDGRNARIEVRWFVEDFERAKANAAELLDSAPDAIVASGNPMLAELQRLSRAIPIVFVQVSDPVGSGFVASLARPGGNITGFHNFEPAMGGKWLGILKEAAINMNRAVVIFGSDSAANVAMLRAAEIVAPSFGVQVTAADVRDIDQIDDVVATFANLPDGGLIVLPHPRTLANHDSIIASAARHRLPAIYPFRYFAAAGGMIAYGIDPVDQWREVARYVDRILRGEKPSELPIQGPTRFELIVNLKTAKALGLTVPQTLLVAADEVIE